MFTVLVKLALHPEAVAFGVTTVFKFHTHATKQFTTTLLEFLISTRYPSLAKLLIVLVEPVVVLKENQEEVV